MWPKFALGTFPLPSPHWRRRQSRFLRTRPGTQWIIDPWLGSLPRSVRGLGVEKRLDVRGRSGAGGRQSCAKPPGPAGRSRGPDPCKTNGHASAPPSSATFCDGRGCGGRIPAASPSPFPTPTQALAIRPAPSSLDVQGPANSCSKAFYSSVLCGDVCSKPSAYFKNI